MERVPQIVSERLKTAAPAVEHLDADVLTAFSERSLPQTERKAVLEHLARCGECREIVALALPASEPTQQIARPAYGGWLTWPVLRWGLIAAGLVAITSFGVMRYQRHSSMTAYNAHRPEAASKTTNALPVSPPSSEPAEAKLQAPASSLPTEKRDLASSNVGPGPAPEAAAPALIRSAQPKARQSTSIGGPRVQWQQNANNMPQQTQAISQAKQLHGQQLPTNAAAPAQVADSAIQSGAQAANIGTPVLESQRIDQQPIQGGHADSKIERVKPAGTSIMSASKVLAPDFPAPSSPAGAPLDRNSHYAGSPGVPMRWTISSGGGLQRSLDQGSTWQEVDVNNSSPAATTMALMKAPRRAKEATNGQTATNDSLAKDSLTNERLDKETPAKKDAASLVFRAVSSNGPDVWAGASGGLLYHSLDAGSHWTRVVPSASGVTLTGDILSLEFIDPQHGRVVTSTPEVWTTSDAGQSWQKQ